MEKSYLVKITGMAAALCLVMVLEESVSAADRPAVEAFCVNNRSATFHYMFVGSVVFYVIKKKWLPWVR